MEQIIRKYTNLFQGIGEIWDRNQDKDVHVYRKFHMKPEAIPVAQKPRPAPYHLQRPLQQWLEQGLEEDFEKVPNTKPVTWCSPLVVQHKPKFAQTSTDELGTNKIWANFYLWVPNQTNTLSAVSRTTQSPTVEEFVHKFHDCKICTKLDPCQGYHQLKLDPASRAIATFNTPWRNYRPKWLVISANWKLPKTYLMKPYKRYLATSLDASNSEITSWLEHMTGQNTMPHLKKFYNEWKTSASYSIFINASWN